MAKHESEFAEDVAEKLAAIADVISREASLIREHRWSEVNWNYLERKLPIDDLNSRLPDGKTGRQVNRENIVVERFARPYGRWSKKQTSIELPRVLGLFHPQFPPRNEQVKMSSDLKLDVALKLLKVAGHKIGDAHIPPPPHGEGMRIWIDGVPCTFEDVFKMAGEELRESAQPG